MTFQKVRFSPRCSRAFFLAACVASAPAFAAGALHFDQVFNDKGEPAALDYRATYQLGGTEHHIEVWRDRDRKLRRRTDDALETYVLKSPKDAEWRMVVLDLKRKIRTDVERSNLYRIGHFTDWFSLSHALARPSGDYSLTRLAAAPVNDKPLLACQWYVLTRAGSASNICWSPSLNVPLLITDAGGTVQWRVTFASKNALPAATFAVQDQGFVVNDANSDIRGD